jgi:hypothetical protein
MLFASLILDRAPLQWSQFPDALGGWLQNAGGVAAFGIAIVLLARYLQREVSEIDFWSLSPRLRSLLPTLKACIIASAVGFALLLVIWLGDRMGIPGLKRFVPRSRDTDPTTIGDWMLSLSGLLALFVVCCPIAVDFCTRISFGRIWAIAWLSWKEAIRGRIIWVFGIMALVFLFADWFVPAKAEDQLRSYVRVVYWSMTPLFLLTAALLGSFSIPNDVKSNSIHTIVTKPVEKIEIVLGRFFGYATLLTIGLLIVSGLSLIYVVRGVNAEAAQESEKARVPLYGRLLFVGTKSETEGENVGREWTHRSYITGPTKFKQQAVRQYAVWDFTEIPAHLRTQSSDIIFEFAFDIYRLSKGDVKEEGKGVRCSFTFVEAGAFPGSDRNRQAHDLEGRTDQMRKEQEKKKNELAEKLEKQIRGKNDAERAELEKKHDEEVEKMNLELVKEYRIYEVRGEPVTDYHTQVIPVPAAAFQALMSPPGNEPRDPKSPAMRVFFSVDVSEQAQMVGVATQDFYLLESVRPFWQNFLKGIIGMWCTYMLVLGVAVACSTYMSGVISFLLTLILYLAGLNVTFLRDIAEGRSEGGGPLEAMARLSTKLSPATKLESTPTNTIMQAVDSVFGWWVGRLLNLIPDLGRHDLHMYVANGFDIGWLNVLLLDNFLPLLGYLIPWAILAYYLMKYREIANPQ